MASTKVSADVMRNQIDFVMHCISSLQSCRDWEVPTETDHLKSAVGKLQAMELKRKNLDLTALKGRVCDRATTTIGNNVSRIKDKPPGY